jgi:hypothetical protein
VLYEPAQFEPLADEPWDPARIEDAIATIVADADAAFDLEALWPAHEWDGWQEPLPMKNLRVGAAGVIWALDALRRLAMPRPRSTSPPQPCARSNSSAPSPTPRRMSMTTRRRSYAARQGRCSSPYGSPPTPHSRTIFTRSSMPTSRTRRTT